ncbi:putative HNHc nuclease [Clostridium sp. YIM B02551]|uniref:putative HNHc nuclease n=1 Tax=Clostridium sp. YIM B02551 TaxID=2910679 RepID=UPI001EECD7B2|nr:putative HNHc nuclease [Clostridium sp. YIM B02551]
MKQVWNSFQVRGIKEVANKTILQIETDIPKDQILRYKSDSGILGEIRLEDYRTITAEQRKKIFAFVKDVSLYTGYEAEYVRDLLTLSFCYENNIEPFSLSNCSLEVAREFISYLIDFCISLDIPLSQSALERTDDIGKFLYMTIKKEICSICGDKGTIYTLDRDKNKMCLCQVHHDLAKSKGLLQFQKLYKVYGIKFQGG